MVQQKDISTCQHKSCRNKINTEAPIRFCYLHEHEQLAVTPKGQHGFRNATGLGSWQHRLQKEKVSEFPKDSAGIKGYPYFTIDDLKSQLLYVDGNDLHKPTAVNVLERFPLQSIIVMGRNITGGEIAVIDGNGNIHSLDGKDPEYADEMRGFSVDDGATTLGVADDERYQVIIIDDVAIMDAASENGFSLNKAS